MANYLLDTHALLWFIDGDESLPNKIIKKIKDIDNQCYLSIASLWEISIKMNLKKLDLSSGFHTLTNFCEENDIEILPITFEHILQNHTLADYHRDPFDRMIIAQSIAENLTILSKDRNFKHYPVKVLW